MVKTYNEKLFIASTKVIVTTIGLKNLCGNKVSVKVCHITKEFVRKKRIQKKSVVIQVVFLQKLVVSVQT